MGGLWLQWVRVNDGEGVHGDRWLEQHLRAHILIHKQGVESTLQGGVEEVESFESSEPTPSDILYLSKITHANPPQTPTNWALNIPVLETEDGHFLKTATTTIMSQAMKVRAFVLRMFEDVRACCRISNVCVRHAISSLLPQKNGFKTNFGGKTSVWK